MQQPVGVAAFRRLKRGTGFLIGSDGHEESWGADDARRFVIVITGPRLPFLDKVSHDFFERPRLDRVAALVAVEVEEIALQSRALRRAKGREFQALAGASVTVASAHAGTHLTV